MSECDHYFEEIPIDQFISKIKCTKCGLTETISTKFNYLRSGKIMTMEGEGE